MKTFTISLFCALFIISCQPSLPEKKYSPSFSVSDSLAIAKIPITPQKFYRYDKDTIRHNVMEFGCTIIFDQYELAFRLFKFGAKEKKGTIKDLLSDGQTDIWRIEGIEGSVVAGHLIKIDFADPYLVFRIEKKKTINLLFKDHPTNCSYALFGFRAPKLNGDIIINYE